MEVAEIQQLIDGLPEGYKMVFIMYAIEGYKHHEIAEILKITEGTSKSQLFKARKMLQKRLKQLNKISNGTN
jgi:RNA polymerase sigma-70 factor (ECF subfamily)